MNEDIAVGTRFREGAVTFCVLRRDTTKPDHYIVLVSVTGVGKFNGRRSGPQEQSISAERIRGLMENEAGYRGGFTLNSSGFAKGHKTRRRDKERSARPFHFKAGPRQMVASAY